MEENGSLKNYEKWSFMFIAARYGNTEIVRKLIMEGINYNMCLGYSSCRHKKDYKCEKIFVSYWGGVPLNKYGGDRYCDCVFCENCGDDYDADDIECDNIVGDEYTGDFFSDKEIRNTFETTGVTPFLMACYSGNLDTIKYLASLDDDINHYADNDEGEIGPIQFAAMSGNKDAMRFLTHIAEIHSPGEHPFPNSEIKEYYHRLISEESEMECYYNIVPEISSHDQLDYEMLLQWKIDREPIKFIESIYCFGNAAYYHLLDDMKDKIKEFKLYCNRNLRPLFEQRFGKLNA